MKIGILKNISRRRFCKLALASFAGYGISKYATFIGNVSAETEGALPSPVANNHSTEICLNSRKSYHGGWSGSATDQQLSNVLWATGKAPITGTARTIYVATPNNVYTYDPITHELSIHLGGDYRGDSSAAFQIGWTGDTIFDAGTALELAQLESVSLWDGTISQLASCPRNSYKDKANDNWNPDSTIHIATSFGIRDVSGLTSTRVVKSLDNSLPNPLTGSHTDIDQIIKDFKDGEASQAGVNNVIENYMNERSLEDVLADLIYTNSFAQTDLTLAELSQLLWAAYGCTGHITYNSKAGLTVPSAWADYYLTKRIYSATQDGVYRYHNRESPGTDKSTRDHRIEQINASDVRDDLQSAVSNLPQAPCYVIICLDTSQSSSTEPLLETGFAAGALLLQATALNLGCHFKTNLTGTEQSDIQTITDIPASDIPTAVVPVGYPSS